MVSVPRGDAMIRVDNTVNFSFAESAGRIVEQAEEGVFLVQSAEPVVEPVAEFVAQSVAEAIAEPVEVIAQPEVTVTKASYKYATLGTIFFRGSIAGQIKSVFKTRETNPAKVVEYRQALANGDCTWVRNRCRNRFWTN
jgi:hypothetical protein